MPVAIPPSTTGLNRFFISEAIRTLPDSGGGDKLVGLNRFFISEAIRTFIAFAGGFAYSQSQSLLHQRSHPDKQGRRGHQAKSGVSIASSSAKPSGLTLTIPSDERH